jgi:hypothetical protein
MRIVPDGSALASASRKFASSIVRSRGKNPAEFSRSGRSTFGPGIESEKDADRKRSQAR